MVTTRAGRLDDAGAVARLWTAANLARHAEIGLPLGPVAGEGVVGAEHLIHCRLADPAALAVLAHDEGDLVAMALVLQALDRDGASSDPLPGLAHIAMVAVCPDRWGQGLAALVLGVAQHDARQRGFTHAQLWTHETNHRAQRLYERLGWAVSGRAMIDDYGEAIRHYVRAL